MKKEIKQVEGWRTSDGKMHASEYDAVEHQKKVNLMGLLDSLGVCRGGPWSSDMVAVALIENQRELRRALYW
jgi:hypothetical protein